MKNTSMSRIVLLLAFLFLTKTMPAVAASGVRVHDALDRKVFLPAPAERIVALAPHIVENTYSAGAGGKLVGAVSYSDFPDKAQEIPVVGSHQAWSMESIVALQPDLIIMWGSGAGLNRLEALENLGFTVYVSEPRALDDIVKTIRDIGALAGTEPISELEASRVEREFQRLRQQYSAEPVVSVFYQMWDEPLQTLNDDHLISRVIELCGGTNVFGDAPDLAPKINIESVLERDPEVIVASGMDAARPEWLDDWRMFPGMQAVRSQGLYFVHPDILQRPTARILEGATELCRQLDTHRQSAPFIAAARKEPSMIPTSP